ncbi:hypothetical protein D3C76_1799690 [compost metagenome]
MPQGVMQIPGDAHALFPFDQLFDLLIRQIQLLFEVLSADHRADPERGRQHNGKEGQCKDEII